MFDHDVNFRADGKNVAILTQPYDHVDLDAVRTWAVGRGLEAHVPPDPLASIHYPGGTLFLVITKPGVEVRWLPDQDGRLADRWAARMARYGDLHPNDRAVAAAREEAQQERDAELVQEAAQ